MYSGGKFNNKKKNGEKYSIYIILDLLNVYLAWLHSEISYYLNLYHSYCSQNHSGGKSLSSLPLMWMVMSVTEEKGITFFKSHWIITNVILKRFVQVSISSKW